jgi:hypothetical protein
MAAISTCLPSLIECLAKRGRPSMCENTKSENPSGKLQPIYYILGLKNGLQWFVRLLTRPVIQRYPTCEKIKIVFTQSGPKGELSSFSL